MGGRGQVDASDTWRTARRRLRRRKPTPTPTPTPEPVVTLTAARGSDKTTATVSWTKYGESNFDYYRFVVCTGAQFSGTSCSGTVYRSEAYSNADTLGPVTVTGLDAATGYGVILQVWRKGVTGALKFYATIPPPPLVTVTATRGSDKTTATVSWTKYEGSNFDYYRFVVCTEAQYDGVSCVGTVYGSPAYFDADTLGPVTVTGLEAATGYGVILQVWRKGVTGALKFYATIAVGGS